MSGRDRQQMVWRAFRVEPQKEFVAQHILARNGHTVEVPLEYRLRRATRYDKRKVAVKYPMVLGYVFVRLPVDYPWGMLFDFRLVKSIVGFAGQPAAISDAAMGHLMRTAEQNNPHRTSINTRMSFVVGDTVEVAEGPFQGWSGKVEEIKGEKARLVFQMLGAARDIDIPCEQLQGC